jgi:RNA recognition motif-containing protein
LAEEQELRDLFERFGRVTRVFLARDRETQRAKGFAFISYADRGDAASACEKLDGCTYTPEIEDGYNGMLTDSLSSRLPPSHSSRRVRQAVYLKSFLALSRHFSFSFFLFRRA